MTVEATIKRIARLSFLVAALGIFAIVELARCSGPSSTSWPSSEPVSAFRLDSLDVLPAKAAGLRLAAAWRITASGISENTGVYHWADGSDGDVEIMCVTPLPTAAECDRSTPKRLHFGALSACGFTGYDRDTGPFIEWPGCTARAARTPKIKGIFDRLRASAEEAAAWSERYRSAVAGGDKTGFSVNRADGLLAASRAGNPSARSVSGQLD